MGRKPLKSELSNFPCKELVNRLGHSKLEELFDRGEFRTIGTYHFGEINGCPAAAGFELGDGGWHGVLLARTPRDMIKIRRKYFEVYTGLKKVNLLFCFYLFSVFLLASSSIFFKKSLINCLFFSVSVIL